MSETPDYQRDPRTGVLTLHQTAQVRQRLAERERAKAERTMEQRVRKIEDDQGRIISLLERLVTLVERHPPR